MHILSGGSGIYVVLPSPLTFTTTSGRASSWMFTFRRASAADCPDAFSLFACAPQPLSNAASKKSDAQDKLMLLHNRAFGQGREETHHCEEELCSLVHLGVSTHVRKHDRCDRAYFRCSVARHDNAAFMGRIPLKLAPVA